MLPITPLRFHDSLGVGGGLEKLVCIDTAHSVRGAEVYWRVSGAVLEAGVGAGVQ